MLRQPVSLRFGSVRLEKTNFCVQTLLRFSRTTNHCWLCYSSSPTQRLVLLPFSEPGFLTRFAIRSFLLPILTLALVSTLSKFDAWQLF